MKNKLDRKVRYSCWYLEKDWAVREFLEYICKNYTSLFLNKREKRKQSDNLLDDIEYEYIIDCEEGRGFFRLTKEDVAYFLKLNGRLGNSVFTLRNQKSL